MIDLEDYFKVSIDLQIPKVKGTFCTELWAFSLGLKQHSLGPKVHIGKVPISGEENLFISFYLELLRYFYELGRIPIFQTPRIVSITRERQIPNGYRLDLEILLVQQIPRSLLRIPIQVSLDLCKWMAINKASEPNIQKVFNEVVEKLIGPLERRLPGGKSTIPILKVAHERGIPYSHLGAGIYQLGWGSKARIFDRSSSESDSAVGLKMAQDKLLSASILRSAGLPSPVHYAVGVETDAVKVAAKLQFPVVVKPADLERGEGVTVGVNDDSSLSAAFEKAHRLSRSKKVIVERQVLGMCHRLFIANNKLLYAVKRNPISVVGNGISTVRDLVADEVKKQASKPPWIRSLISPIDEIARNTFKDAGISEDWIPGVDEMVRLRPIQSNEWGGSPEDVTAIVHEENLQVALQATRLARLHVAGIDIISPDISKPWYENGAIINEVNFCPLLGVGDISRSYIPRYLDELIDGDGKIPIEPFESDDAAMRKQEEYVKAGLRCYLVTRTVILDADGNKLVVSLPEIKQRIRALLRCSDVDAISVSLQSGGGN